METSYNAYPDLDMISPPWDYGQPVALIIGGSGGIGKATYELFQQRGWLVVPTYNRGKVEHPSAVGMNVQYKPSVERVVGDVYKEYGKINAVVNCSGVLQQKPYDEITLQDWNDMLDINLLGTFYILQVTMPYMLRQGGGAIVTMSSVGGQTGGVLAVHYAAAKAGIISLTKSFARIGAPEVRVNAIAPGLTNTPMSDHEITSNAGRHKIKNIPLQRAGYPEEIAEACWFAVTNTYMTGATLDICGGQSMR